MEQTQELVQEQSTAFEPETSDNQSAMQTNEGQAFTAPSGETALGKFKSVDELAKAYRELEKFQGLQSKELGELRQNTAMLNNINDVWKTLNEIKFAKDELVSVSTKYDKPEYFQNQAFRDMYKEAYLALGSQLDADKFIDLLENYVATRLYAEESKKAMQNENERVLRAMTFSKNNNSSITPPKKRLDEMTPKEVDELLERLI